MFCDSDPTTSSLAAAEVPVTKAQVIGMVVARHLCRTHGDCTANEIANIGAMAGSNNAETIRKRVHELVGKGLLTVVGTRRCRVTGVKARTFQVKQ